MILTSDEHYIGRVVEDSRFQIESYSVSAKHCVIFRKKVASEDGKESSNYNTSVFLKDTRLFIVVQCFLFYFILWGFFWSDFIGNYVALTGHISIGRRQRGVA